MKKHYSMFFFTIVLLWGCADTDKSMVAWWTFDSAENGIVKDQSGNEWDALSHGAVLGDGKTGKSFYSDGKGYLEVKHTPAMVRLI